MSGKIDERIVSMRFNGDQFQKGVADTSKSLESLKKNLNMDGAAKGLNDIDAAAKNFSLAGIAQGVSDIAGKFSAMSVIGITALANIASKAVDTGLTMARSLTLDPIKAGFAEYELKMGSIQTILANTARYGTQLPEVVANLDQLNQYADKTIYNFGDMTKNIGLFTNAGIKIGDATSMIKGFSNEAAASGTNAQGAASAAYQLSQALSAGTIRLMDWRSLQNVGMGNKNMQNGLIEIAQAMGQFNDTTTDAEAVTKDFNGSLEKGWLSADVMSTYLKIMAGDMDAASMAALGLSDTQIAAFQAQQKMSEDAATKVRTFTQLIGTMQEAVGSGWTETFDLLIGDFNKATDLWTAVNNELGGIIGAQADARNALIKAFVDIGGRETLLNSINNVWQALKSVIGPISQAFKDIFPPVTAQNILAIAKAVESFTKGLILGSDAQDKLKRAFKGLFAILDIGVAILQNVFGLFGKIGGKASEAGGGILDFAAKIGDWLVKARDVIKSGDGIGKVFDWISEKASNVLKYFNGIGESIAKALTFDSWTDFWKKTGQVFESVGKILQPLGQWISEAVTNVKNALKTIGSAIADAFKNMDFSTVAGLALGGLSTALGGGIFLMIKKLVSTIKDGIGVDLTGGFLDTFKGALSQLTDTLGTMQAKLKAEILKQIAIAIGILAAAVLVLSFVDPVKLGAATLAIGVMAAELAAAMKMLEGVTSNKAFSSGKLAAISAGMIGMATALLILSAAVSIMGHLKWDELAKGMAGTAAGLGLLVGAMALLVKIPVAKTSASAGSLIILSTSLIIFAGALKIMGSMNWEELAKGMSSVAVGLGLMVGAMALMNGAKFSPLGALAMIGIAVALGILSGALKIFSTMSWDDIGRSLTVLAGSLIGLSVAVGVMANPSSILGAAAMIGVAVAMNILSAAMKIFATFSWEEIGKSMVMLGGSLAILAAAMAIMGIPLVALGGLALLVVSVGLMALAPALVLLGTMSWDAIGRGLTMLAASLAIMAVLGLLLIPASVGFLLLGAGIALLGAGVLMAGEGLALFALGLGAVVAAVALGTEPIRLFFQMIIDQIPAFMASLAQGIIDFGTTLANGATQLTQDMGTLIGAILTVINEKSPEIIDTLGNLLLKMLDRVNQDMPQWVEKGGQLIINFLNGLNAQMPGIVQAATRTIITFIQQIGNSAGQIAEAGAQTMVRFINSLANTVSAHSGEMRDAGMRLAFAIADGMTGGLFSGASRVINAAVSMASRALEAAKNFLGIHSPSREFMKLGGFSAEGMANGLLDNTPMVERAATRIGDSALTALRNSLSDIKAGVDTNLDFNPTITPVLDLSAINQGSKLIGGILTPPTLRVDNSYAYASSIAESQRQFEDSQNGSNPSDVPPSGTVINFTQNNNSPKELSAAEIYRNTKNQLATIQKEGVLSPSA